MKAPITQAQAWAVIAESAGWNAKALPVLPDLTLMWADINAWHESKNPYPKNVAAVNETVIAMLQAYGQQCAAHAREMALSEAAKVAAVTVCDTHIPTGVQIYGSRAGKAIEALKGK